MSRTEPFEKEYELYDAWFDENQNVYESELLAVRRLLPTGGRIVEIGVGSGRFASRLGIAEGVEPAERIAALAEARGVRILRGCAECLPLGNETCDALLYVTTLCFVDDVDLTFHEASRVLKPGGCVVLAFIPKDSRFGTLYDRLKQEDAFYRDATFYTAKEVLAALEKAGLRLIEAVQTLTGPPETANQTVEAPSPGLDRGSFVVLRAGKAEKRSSRAR
ncbi:MAG: class I SAM-dependent methyltransferase [Candidatus Bipolaricaulota bacterium]|jgi:SAM-dependent methyltransferase|nr:class I SAM-dependent methyltransferase [Candidatus Bipolaricaulota bacterium]